MGKEHILINILLGSYANEESLVTENIELVCPWNLNLLLYAFCLLGLLRGEKLYSSPSVKLL